MPRLRLYRLLSSKFLPQNSVLSLFSVQLDIALHYASDLRLSSMVSSGDGNILLKAIGTRPKRLGGLYKCGLNDPEIAQIYPMSLAMDNIGKPKTDLALMSAHAIICTATPDREKEIIQPTGGNYDFYRTNPVVLWDHGFEPSMPTAIAKCEHPDGSMALSVVSRGGEDFIEATSYFSSHNLNSEQIFHLVNDGIVRATSIHVDPKPGSMKMQTVDGAKVMVVGAWDMLEWSWANIGVNPEAVRKCLATNRLAGRPIAEGIVKSLRMHAQKPKAMVQGMTLPTVVPKSETGSKDAMFNPEKLKDMTDDELAACKETASPAEKKLIGDEIAKRSKSKSFKKKDDKPADKADDKPADKKPPVGDVGNGSEKDKSGGDEFESTGGVAQMSYAGADKPNDTAGEVAEATGDAYVDGPVGDTPADDSLVEGVDDESVLDGDQDQDVDQTGVPGELPLGGQTLSSVSSSAQQLVELITGALPMLEKESVKQYLTETALPTLEGLLSEIEGLYAQDYSQFGSLAAPSDQDIANEEEVVKSWLAASKLRQLRVSGMARQLSTIGALAKSTPPGRKLLSIAKSIDKILIDAKDIAKVALERESAMQSRIDALSSQVCSLMDIVNKNIPARRSA